jgi:hypothetical protein
MKQVTLYDFLTESQIEEAHKIWEKEKAPAKEICDKVIRPNIAEIDRKLGQANDPMYLAYACEHVFNEAAKTTDSTDLAASAADIPPAPKGPKGTCMVCGGKAKAAMCKPCEDRFILAQAWMEEEVKKGAVLWDCDGGHFGMFKAGNDFSVRWHADGHGSEKYKMPKNACPACKGKP